MVDYVMNYLKEHNIPVTRENYIEINWMGEVDPKQPLPAELEAEMPESLQLNSPSEGTTKDFDKALAKQEAQGMTRAQAEQYLKNTPEILW